MMLVPDPPIGECCEDMEFAVKGGYISEKNGELWLSGNLKSAFPEAKVGNVLTGETYDPARFVMTLALKYCPFCGMVLNAESLVEKNPQGLVPFDDEDGDAP